MAFWWPALDYHDRQSSDTYAPRAFTRQLRKEKRKARFAFFLLDTVPLSQIEIEATNVKQIRTAASRQQYRKP